MFENNKAKAKVVYDAIAGSDGFYNSPVDPSVQSLMNVPFTIPSHPELEKEFVSEASKVGLVRKAPIFTAIVFDSACLAVCYILFAIGGRPSA